MYIKNSKKIVGVSLIIFLYNVFFVGGGSYGSKLSSIKSKLGQILSNFIFFVFGLKGSLHNILNEI